MLGAALVPVALWGMTEGHAGVLMASAVGLLALWPVHVLRTTREAARLNRLLATTGQLLVLYSVLFAVGWNL